MFVQSIANMMYSFGKMRRPLKASVCRKVEKALLARPAAFKDLEVSNILYGFVKTRYNSPELLGVLDDRCHHLPTLPFFASLPPC